MCNLNLLTTKPTIMNNREIKFRMWDSHLSVMHENYQVYHEFVTQLADKSGKYIPLQYTGLKDKNGKEIYEGDVLKCVHFTEGKKTHYLTHYVVWNSEWHLWQTVAPNNVDAKLGTNGNPMLATYARQGDFEVIGNIYQQPELIS